MGPGDSDEAQLPESDLLGTAQDGEEAAEEARGLGLPARAGNALIRGYQKLSQYTPPMCRFHPTCSEYTRQAIVKYGLLKGSAMGAWRICRCNPWSKGGYDPVP